MNLPSKFRPTATADFIGDAGRFARVIDKLVAASLPTGEAIKLLINGDPGIGKSELAGHLKRGLGCQGYNETKMNGTSVKIEWLEELARSFRYTDWFDSYRLIWIDEADKIPSVAQVRFLTLLDDLPKKTAVVCTSNCKLEEFEQRFQSRFVTMELTPPKSNEIFNLLSRLVANPKADDHLRRIAEMACGNVRQATLDADALVMALA